MRWSLPSRSIPTRCCRWSSWPRPIRSKSSKPTAGWAPTRTLQGDAFKAALDQQNWDDSVKSLTATPDVLDMMSNKLDWTQQLGDAVLAQQPDVMDAIQRLRTKAQANNKLTSTSQQTVTTQQQDGRQYIYIAPTDPDELYVPYYDPSVVYGPWPYPDYPPYYWPPPAYIGAGIDRDRAGVRHRLCARAMGLGRLSLGRRLQLGRQQHQRQALDQRQQSQRQQLDAQSGASRQRALQQPGRRGQIRRQQRRPAIVSTAAVPAASRCCNRAAAPVQIRAAAPAHGGNRNIGNGATRNKSTGSAGASQADGGQNTRSRGSAGAGAGVSSNRGGWWWWRWRRRGRRRWRRCPSSRRRRWRRWCRAWGGGWRRRPRVAAAAGAGVDGRIASAANAEPIGTFAKTVQSPGKEAACQ